MRKIIAVILLLSTVLTFTGCNALDIIGSFTSYWEGMTKKETVEFIKNELNAKYGEDFDVRALYKRSGTAWDAPPILLGNCSPQNDSNIIFEIEALAIGKDERYKIEMKDTYIQSIVGKEMRKKAEEVLSKYFKNYAVEVYVYGLAYAYDSKIRSSAEATIENFISALPDDNHSVIWIAIDNNEAIHLDTLSSYLEEMTRMFSLSNCSIDCYYVSSDIVQYCKESIETNHIEYNYDAASHMAVTLSSRRPFYKFLYHGKDGEFMLMGENL